MITDATRRPRLASSAFARSIAAISASAATSGTLNVRQTTQTPVVRSVRISSLRFFRHPAVESVSGRNAKRRSKLLHDGAPTGRHTDEAGIGHEKRPRKYAVAPSRAARSVRRSARRLGVPLKAGDWESRVRRISRSQACEAAGTERASPRADSGENEGRIEYLVADSIEAVVSLAQMGIVEIHTVDRR